jgi:hypothetical protein
MLLPTEDRTILLSENELLDGLVFFVRFQKLQHVIDSDNSFVPHQKHELKICF